MTEEQKHKASILMMELSDDIHTLNFLLNGRSHGERKEIEPKEWAEHLSLYMPGIIERAEELKKLAE